jgi:uncharacterized surface protein with fasciclin (FAS1) repeats
MHIKTAFCTLIAAASAQSLIEALQAESDLTQLYNALQYVPEVADALSAASNITILAPVDSAFERLLNEPLNAENEALETQNVNGTTILLSYHVISGSILSSDITTTPTFAQTLLTREVKLFNNARTNVTGGQYVGVVNNGSAVQVLSGDLDTSNVVQAVSVVFYRVTKLTSLQDIEVGGVIIHKIDKVLRIPNNVTTTLPEVGLTAAVASAARAGLAETLDLANDLTFFVPTNEAFDLAGSVLNTVDTDTLRSALEYHAVTGAVLYSDNITDTTLTSVQGNELAISVVDGTVFVNQAKVVIPNIILSNGVAHVIDT